MKGLHPARKLSRFTFSSYHSAAPIVRQLLGVDRLSRTQAAEVRAAVARHEQRAAARVPDATPIGGRVALLRERLRVSVQAAVEPLLDDLFKIAQSRWAGGETTNDVRIDRTPDAAGVTERVWSSNGK